MRYGEITPNNATGRYLKCHWMLNDESPGTIVHKIACRFGTPRSVARIWRTSHACLLTLGPGNRESYGFCVNALFDKPVERKGAPKTPAADAHVVPGESREPEVMSRGVLGSTAPAVV